MPLTTLMTWEGKTRRWRKVYHGKTYTVSCRSLEAPETKEASAAKANAWWREKQLAIESGAASRHPHSEHLVDLDRRSAWSREAGEDAAARNLEAERRRVEGGGEPSDPHELLRDAWRALFGGEPPEPARLRELFGAEAVWEDRIDRGNSAPFRGPETVTSFVDSYLEVEFARYRDGELSAAEYDVARRSLHFFRDWLENWAAEHSPGRGVKVIDVRRWDAWFAHLRTQPLSREVRIKRWRFSRQFVSWLAGLGEIVPPTNLHARRYRFPGGKGSIRTVPVGEFRAAVAVAKPPVDVSLMLMANCGFTQVDVSNLRQSKIDWTTGRLAHRRSKTARYETVPTVVYPLWPETLELLKPYRQDGDDLVFRTRQGQPLVHDQVTAEGKRGKSDALRLAWDRHRKRTGATWQLKWLRKTSATLVKDHSVYGRAVELFLGHAPATVTDQSYVAPSPELLIEAVLWLRGAYGFGVEEGG